VNLPSAPQKASTAAAPQGVKPIDQGPPGDVDRHIHVLFPSGCNGFQQWQAELLLFSHQAVGQKGKITRIVHGCEDHSEVKDKQWLVHQGDNKNLEASFLEKSTHPNYTLVHTPGVEGAKEFPYFNKPFSIDYWAKNGQHEEDDIVIILDIDEMFLKPLTQHPLPPEALVSSWSDQEVTNVVKPKRPVGQMYGLGPIDFLNKDKICGEGSKCAQTSGNGWNRFTVGPPLFIQMSDLHQLATYWWEYTRPVFEVRPIQLSEMFAYMLGAANMGLEQVRLDNFMVSAPNGGEYGEGWGFITDTYKMDCRDPTQQSGGRMAQAPTFLHFCQTYVAYDSKGFRWLFHKGHIPENILDCDSPILKAPPADLFNTQKTKKAKRNAYMVCNMHYYINQMLLAYKEKFCTTKGIEADRSERIRLTHAKSLGCGSNPKFCYPLAQLETAEKLEMVPRDPNDNIYE